MEQNLKATGDIVSEKLQEIYCRLYAYFGPRHWWPADSPFEVIVGAILTQNTAWRNVEKAIDNLKGANLLDPKMIYAIDELALARMIRSSGYYQLKAKRLKNFVNFLFERYDGSLDEMFSEEVEELRGKLLEIKGIGPETADSILLYAGGKPVFVVDAYTKRIFSRHNFIDNKATYYAVQDFFMAHLPREVRLFNEYHALIVKLGHLFCRRTPVCEGCPLEDRTGEVNTPSPKKR
jgi:endonuclease-3 related protein